MKISRKSCICGVAIAAKRHWKKEKQEKRTTTFLGSRVIRKSLGEI